MCKLRLGLWATSLVLVLATRAEGGFIYVSGTNGFEGYYKSLDTGATFTNAMTTEPTQSPSSFKKTENGLTLVTGAIDTLLYNKPADFSGLPTNSRLFVSGTQVGLLTFTTPYFGSYLELHRTDQAYAFTAVNGDALLTAVPEPSAGMLALLGCGALAWTAFRRRGMTV
jgi:hypothetical protein